MIKTLAAAAVFPAALIISANASQQDAADTYPRKTVPYQYQYYPPTVPVAATVHHRRHARAAPPEPSEGKEIERLRADLAAVRRELDAVRARVGPEWPAGPLAPFSGVPFPSEDRPGPADPVLASLPDLRGPVQPPAAPVPLPGLPRGSEEALEVAEARAYLVRTATIGYTMARQTPEVAIGRLHPAFAVKLARAIRRARAEGLARCGVFSAYRPPVFGVGGFSDKFNSLHSYGLAADVAGIGSPGSVQSHLWQKIVHEEGLYLPYGPNNQAEFNHTQLEPTKVANNHLRRTITARGPLDLRSMWLASGVPDYILAGEARAPAPASAKLLPTNDYSQ